MICEYLEGRLSSPVALAIQGHLAACDDCRAVHDAAERTLAIYFDRDVYRGKRTLQKMRVA